MAATNNFTAGLDPTGEASLTASELLQMIQLAAPTSNRGILYYNSSEPNLTDNPELVRCIWLDTTTVPPIPKVRNTSLNSWVVLPISAGAITAASQITDSIITLAKLAASEATGKGSYILRANAAGDGFELVAVTSIFSDNTLPIAKIVKGTTGQLLRSTPSGVEWATINYATEINALTNTVNLNVLSTGGLTNKVLQTNGSGVVSLVTATDIFNSAGGLPITNISPGTGNAGKYPKVNAAGTALEFAAIGGITTWTHAPVLLTVSSTLAVEQAHSQGKVPFMWKVLLICETSDLGYATGDQVELSSCGQDGDAQNGITTYADTTKIYMRLDTSSNAPMLRHKTTGTVTAITPASWKYQFNALFV